MPNPDESIQSFLPLQTGAFHILLSLAEEDRHGYAIIRDVGFRTGGKVKLSPGTLYRSIQRMLDQGMIRELDERPAAEEDDERRRYYAITPLGRAVASAEVERLQEMVNLARDRGLAGGEA
jgi:DNA-binding PadR family transcriptional regulator